jgi:enoyl-CoA hydratase/carnithine racemase
MKQDAVLLQVDGPLARITLNRPKVLNAMNLAWTQGLDGAVKAVAAEPDVRVVLVRGAGRAFCAGIDLDMLGAERMPPGFYETQERAFHALETMDKITVAAMHGYCLGGGLQLAISCDIRVCSFDCQLGLPAVLEGLFPALATFRLPRLIGLGPARRLILTGELVDPAEALRLGLIDYLVPAERFDARLAEILETFLAAPRAATMASKRLMGRAFDTSFEPVYDESLPLMADCLASPDVETASLAWRQRRTERRGG